MVHKEKDSNKVEAVEPCHGVLKKVVCHEGTLLKYMAER